MSYIDRNLLPDEQIRFRTKKHLIIFFYPIVVTIIALYAYQYMHTNFILTTIEWVVPLLAFLFVGTVWLEYVTSEFVVTNKRIIMREGFFYRHLTELRINTISQINVEQSCWDRCLIMALLH